MTTIAVLGTGIMGAPIARNLAAAGFEVRAWNRTRDEALALVDDPSVEGRVRVCDTPREATGGADVLITTVSDADAVSAVVTGSDGALAAAGGGLLWLQLSTVGVAGIERLAGIAAERGVAFVDAPVLGTREPAEQAALTVLASGPDDLQQRCRPVFDAIGRKTIWVGPTGRGTRLKLVVNSWVLALTTATAEAMALADGFGLDPRRFLDTIAGGPLDVGYAHVKGAAMLKRDFPPSFPLAGAVKDAGLIVEAGREVDVPMLLAEAVHRQMAAAAASGHEQEDMAAVWWALRDR